MKCLVLLGLLACTFLVRSERRCCFGGKECFTDDKPYDNVPLPLCEDEVRPNAKLFVRGDNGKGTPITPTNIPAGLKGNKRTIFIVHGFLQQGNSFWMNDVRKSILKKYDVNVIQNGWGEGSQTIDYAQAAGNARLVGSYMAQIAKTLVAAKGADASNVWCIGHSLGGHICGHMGTGMKLGRITGLDPAGPLFDDHDIKCGLNPSCADYVDVIHTHGKKGFILNLGTMRPLGHADFYPNGGGVQPGCPNYLNTEDLLQSGYVDISPVCSHARAIDYFEESLKGSCVFWARLQCTDPNNIPGSCKKCGDRCARLGYLSDTIGRRGKFYLQTNDDEPFCKG